MLQPLGMAQHGSFPSQRRTVDSTPYFTIDVQSGLSYKHSAERPRLPSLRHPPKAEASPKHHSQRKNRGSLARLTCKTPSLPRTHTSRVLHHSYPQPCPIFSLGCEYLSLSLSRLNSALPALPHPPPHFTAANSLMVALLFACVWALACTRDNTFRIQL